jgi:hypothetical protein
VGGAGADGAGGEEQVKTTTALELGEEEFEDDADGDALEPDELPEPEDEELPLPEAEGLPEPEAAA